VGSEKLGVRGDTWRGIWVGRRVVRGAFGQSE